MSPISKVEMSQIPKQINDWEYVHGMGDDERTGTKPY